MRRLTTVIACVVLGAAVALLGRAGGGAWASSGTAEGPVACVEEGFEAGLGSGWAVTGGEVEVSTASAHSGNHSLRISYTVDGSSPYVRLKFEPTEVVTIEFWLYVATKGTKFTGWDFVGFGWYPIAQGRPYDGPVSVWLLHDQRIEVGTLDPEATPVDVRPEPPEQTLGATHYYYEGRPSDEWVMWVLPEPFPVGQWFHVKMVIAADRQVGFFIGGRYVGTVPGDRTPAIEAMEFGRGLSGKAQQYVVYLDDIRVAFGREGT